MALLKTILATVAMGLLTYEGGAIYLLRGHWVGLIGVLFFGFIFLCGLAILAKEFLAWLTTRHSDSTA